MKAFFYSIHSLDAFVSVLTFFLPWLCGFFFFCFASLSFSSSLKSKAWLKKAKKMQIVSYIQINHYSENNPSCSQLRTLPLHFHILHSKSHRIQLASQHKLNIPQILRRQLHNSQLYLAVFLNTAIFMLWTLVVFIILKF